MKMTAMNPVDIRPIGEEEILILWNDGHRSLYTQRYLRLECPCAQCLDEITGKRLLHPQQVPVNIHLAEMGPVGHYGVRFRWTDGHQTGIYSFDLLRQLCPCKQCTAQKQTGEKQ